MISDKQSLILCGLMAGGIFVSGVLDILNNFVILTLLTLIFAAILGNLLFFRSSPPPNENQNKELK